MVWNAWCFSSRREWCVAPLVISCVLLGIRRVCHVGFHLGQKCRWKVRWIHVSVAWDERVVECAGACLTRDVASDSCCGEVIHLAAMLMVLRCHRWGGNERLSGHRQVELSVRPSSWYFVCTFLLHSYSLLVTFDFYQIFPNELNYCHYCYQW